MDIKQEKEHLLNFFSVSTSRSCVLDAAGFAVFSMERYEADDAMGAAAVKAASDSRVTQVLICTPDKDLAQVVNDKNGIVQFDRRKEFIYDEQAVRDKFGILPESIPDYLALVGDTADGIPGLSGGERNLLPQFLLITNI